MKVSIARLREMINDELSSLVMEQGGDETKQAQEDERSKAVGYPE